MSDLITELKEEHIQISAILNKVNAIGFYTAEGQGLLNQAKNGLLTHLAKEDKELYPKLTTAAETNIDLKRTLDVFAKDMLEISKSAMAFFERYQNGGSGVEFARDFGRLFSMLNLRIGREERILFEEFQKLQ